MARALLAPFMVELRTSRRRPERRRGRPTCYGVRPGSGPRTSASSVSDVVKRRRGAARRPAPATTPVRSIGANAASQASSQPMRFERRSRPGELTRRGLAPAPNLAPRTRSCDAGIEESGGKRTLALEQHGLAPARRTASSRRRPGAGTTVGRPSARPSAFVNCALVAGFGDMRLTGPTELARRARADRRRPRRPVTPSSTTACRLPTRPPSPSLNGVQHLRERATLCARGRRPGGS